MSAASTMPPLVEVPLVEASGAGKSFRNGTVALAGIDLRVAPGAFLSILGPSGCGKSTLLRLIAGLSPPSQGSITLTLAKGGRAGASRIAAAVDLRPTRS